MVATVLRDICMVSGSTSSLMPAVRQWKALVELCAGTLMSSHFTLLLSTFQRLLLNPSTDASIRSLQFPASSSDLAESILALSRVSRGYILHATFTGGVDCAWIAAFAEWVLVLDVEIVDPEGRQIYRSRITTSDIPQVTILSEGPGQNSSKHGLTLTSKLYRISAGQILKHCDDITYERNFIQIRAPWDTILKDTFHSAIATLLDHETGTEFARFVQCMSLALFRFKQPDRRYNYKSHPVSKCEEGPFFWLIRLQRYSSGSQFAQFAAQSLPELASYLQQNIPQSELNQPNRQGLMTLKAIRQRCPCYSCYEGQKPAPMTVGTSICLETLAKTIIVFLCILTVSNIDPGILPSVTGLGNLYMWQEQHGSATQEDSKDLLDSLRWSPPIPIHGPEVIFHVLSGVLPHDPKH